MVGDGQPVCNAVTSFELGDRENTIQRWFVVGDSIGRMLA